ncbi:hypothetical protein HIF96_08930 [Helcococcus kunzii]|uniref:hypothetical protein n=1 Tax=Helcococcus kunzii TaxID=40091 RepID=UPI001C967B15|nr:hypothetical protein [Helcococcus kunzii]QZO76391.1 hypothetical protein HIF96_08930 [Helcococcus kunzii]
MERGNTPSDYLLFLDSEKGSELLSNLRAAIEQVKPFKNRAYLSLLGGVIAAILVWIVFKTFLGLVFIIPGIYFLYVLSKEDHVIYEAQRLFNDGLNRFIFGNDYLNQRCDVDYIPVGFVRGLPNLTGIWKEKTEDLGKFGQSLKIRITRTFKKVEDGKEKEIDKTTYEQGNLYVLPNNSLVKNNQAFFYFETDKFDLLESLGVSFNDKRNLSLTDTELADWYEVSVGGLKDLINTNEDEKFLWTKIITPYFESVLKALVVKYGELHLTIQDGYFFIFQPKRAAKYNSAQYGKLNDRFYNSIWGTNPKAELKEGKSSPRFAIPYLYKIYLNKIMEAMTYYFFMDHSQVDNKKLEESRRTLDYVIEEYNNLDIDEMQELYKGKY